MTDPMQAATAAWYAVKNGTRSPSPTADPTPYIAAIVRAILAAKDAEIAGLRGDAGAKCDGPLVWSMLNEYARALENGKLPMVSHAAATILEQADLAWPQPAAIPAPHSEGASDG